MIKPDPKFFLLMCKRYNFIPEESVFIDDNEANIKTAKELGFKTILFKYPELLRPQLQSLGIDTPPLKWGFSFVTQATLLVGKETLLS